MFFVEYRAWDERRLTREFVEPNANQVYYFDRRRIFLPWKAHDSVTYETTLRRIKDREELVVTEEFYSRGRILGDTLYYHLGKAFYLVRNQDEKLVGMGIGSLVRRNRYCVFKAGYLRK